MDDVRKAVKDARQQVDAALDTGIKTASSVLKGGVEEAQAVGGQQLAKAEEMWEIGSSHLQTSEELLFSKMKEGLNILRANPSESMAAAAALVLLGFPGPRSVLYRSTFGRFRSEEAIFRSAERQAAVIKTTLEGVSKEAQQAMDTKAKALQQVNDGLAILRSSKGELQRLGSTAASAEAKAESLMRELRQLRGQDPLKLRMELAQHKSALTQQRKAVDRDYRRLVAKALV